MPMMSSDDQRNFVAGLLELRQIPLWIRNRLGTVGLLDNAQIDQLMTRVELAVQELAANIVQHAYRGLPGHRIEIHLHHGRQEFVVEIVDDGPAFDPDTVSAPDPDEAQVHGYGLAIVEALTRSHQRVRLGDRNHTQLVFDVPEAAEQA
jgi:serine/threonine-protein kinase RsbW